MASAKDNHRVRERFAEQKLLAKNGLLQIKKMDQPPYTQLSQQSTQYPAKYNYIYIYIYIYLFIHASLIYECPTFVILYTIQNAHICVLLYTSLTNLPHFFLHRIGELCRQSSVLLDREQYQSAAIVAMYAWSQAGSTVHVMDLRPSLQPPW